MNAAPDELAVRVVLEPTVHIAYNGRLMCSAAQTTWSLPLSHRAVPMTEHYKANCNDCFIEYARFYDD